MHPLERARPILETKISVNGKPLILFNNHWKSGASSASLEKVRLGNAQVLRKRIDDLLERRSRRRHNRGRRPQLPLQPKTSLRLRHAANGSERRPPFPRERNRHA